MNNAGKQKWIWVVLALLLAAAFASYWMYSRTNPNVVQAKPDFIVTATDLINASEKDSSKAAKQYANKIIAVTGTAISIDASGAVVLGLDNMPSVVVVGLEQRYMADLQQIKQGEKVTLQGQYSGCENSSNNPDDLLAGLGITIQLRSGGLKKKRLKVKCHICLHDIGSSTHFNLGVYNNKTAFMKTFLFILVTMLCVAHANAQGRYFTKTGTIKFFSKAAMEDIEATNKTVTAVLDTATGAMQFAVQMKGFAFKKALMQQHFNENYVESDKYPKAAFKGTIINNASVNYNKDGTYNVVVKGLLTLHGVTKEIQAPGTINVSASGLTGKSTFTIQLSQFSIAIPALVKDKTSNTISIAVDLNLQPLKS